MFDDLQDPKNIEPAGEPAPGAEPSQPAGGLAPGNPQFPQESPAAPQPQVDESDLLPRESDEGLRSPTEPRIPPTTGGLIERLTGALRMVTRPLRETGRLGDTGSLNRTGTLRGEPGQGTRGESRPVFTGELHTTGSLGRTGVLRGEPAPDSSEETRPGMTGDLRSVEPPASGGTRMLSDRELEEPVPPAPGPEAGNIPPVGNPPVDAGDVPDARLELFGNEPEAPKSERGTGRLVDRLTGTLRQTTGSLRRITEPLRTGSLRRTGPLGARGPEGEGGSAEAGEAQGADQPGAEGASMHPRPPRVPKPSPEAYVPELRQTLADEEGRPYGGRSTGGLLKRITGTLRKVTGPLHSKPGPSQSGTLPGEEPPAAQQAGEVEGAPEASLPQDPSGLPAVDFSAPEPEIADDFLADRLGTAPLSEIEEVPPAFSTGWEDISIPPAPDIDITSEMLTEVGLPAETTEPGSLSDMGEPTLTGDEPISLLDSGAIAAMGRAEEVEKEEYLPDWMAEIRQEAAAEEPGPAQSPAAPGAAALEPPAEGKPRKKGVTGQLKDFITGLLGRSGEKRRPTGDLPDDLVTGRLERSMTTAEMGSLPETLPAEATASDEDLDVPESRFVFGEAPSPASAPGTTSQEAFYADYNAADADAEAEASASADAGRVSGFQFWNEAEPEAEPGQPAEFTFDQLFKEEEMRDQVNAADAGAEAAAFTASDTDTEPLDEGPLGEGFEERGKTRSLEDFDLELGDEGPLSARFGMFRENPPEDRGRRGEETPTAQPPWGREDAGADDTYVFGQSADTDDTAETFDAADVEYKLSPDEESLLWGRTERLSPKDLSEEEGPSIEEIWAPSGNRPEDKGPIPDLADLESLTNLRDQSLEDRTSRPPAPTGGLYIPTSDDSYAATFLGNIDLPTEEIEAPQEDMLRKALEQAGESGTEELINIQDLRAIALEGYQEIAAPRAPQVEAAPVEEESRDLVRGAEATDEEADVALGEPVSAAPVAAAAVAAPQPDLAPAWGLRDRLQASTLMEKVLLVEAALVVLALLVAVPIFVYTIVNGLINPVTRAPASSHAPRPLPADLPTPTGLVLPGGWYFDLKKSTFVQGQWKPAHSEWLEGTELTRVIALPWNPQTEAVIETFKPGDRVRLDLSNGKNLVYTISEVRRVPVSDTSILTDNRPTMVVILYKENAAERWVVFCKP